MKKNNTTEKAILNAEKIAEALKEGTKNSLKDILNEAVSNAIENAEDEEEPKDDEFEEEDVVDTEENPTDDADETAEADDEAEDADEEAAEEDAEAEDDEWSDMDDYKVGDDEYDFTGMEGDDVLKIYNKLGDDDQIYVKKVDDGKFEVSDDETGAEYVIELEPDALDDAEADIEDEPEGEFELELDNEEPADDEDSETEIDINDEEPEDDEDSDIEIDIDDDEEEKLNEENLGYTDNYQKDVFDKKFNMNEPANASATYSMDGGAPKGAEKPWVGKHTEPDYTEVNESENECCGKKGCNCCEDEELDENTTLVQQPNRESLAPENAIERRKTVSRFNGKRTAKGVVNVNETINKIVAQAKAIQNENKEYKECINKIKKSLYEAAVLNVTLGQVVKLLSENTTSKEEKANIVERFKNVKSLNESKALYETISRELNETKKANVVLEKQISAESSNVLNETTIYQQKVKNNPSLNLMERMDNLFKK